MAKIFVTGATGFVGGVLARRLHERGHEVHASVRNPDKAYVRAGLTFRSILPEIYSAEGL